MKEDRAKVQAERYKAKVKELKKQKKWKPEHDQRAKELGLDKLLNEEED